MADRDVRIYEVGPRDGLQNESSPISTDAKLRFIDLVADAGLREIEATSFVSPKAIPQLADADELMVRLERRPGVRYPVLVPNARGLVRAVAAGVDAVCVFTAASEPFTKANINMTIAESIDAFRPVIATARERGWWSRGYVSTAFGCPYQGEVDEAAVVDVALELLELGVDELSIGDTIGVAGPADVRRVVGALLSAGIDSGRLAMHFHDTRGTALANVFAALELGIRTLRRLDRRHRWLPLRARRGGQPRDRGPRLPARAGRALARRRPGCAARRRTARQRDARSSPEHKGRPGRWLAGTIIGRWRRPSRSRSPLDAR